METFEKPNNGQEDSNGTRLLDNKSPCATFETICSLTGGRLPKVLIFFSPRRPTRPRSFIFLITLRTFLGATGRSAVLVPVIKLETSWYSITMMQTTWLPWCSKILRNGECKNTLQQNAFSRTFGQISEYSKNDHGMSWNCPCPPVTDCWRIRKEPPRVFLELIIAYAPWIVRNDRELRRTGMTGYVRNDDRLRRIGVIGLVCNDVTLRKVNGLLEFSPERL